MPWAASPPNTFCQEKVATSILSQSSRWANAADVASQIARPCRSAAIQSRIGDADARGGAVPGEDDVVRPVDLRNIRQRAIGRLEDGGVLEPELLEDIAHPAFAERFPGEHGDRTGAEQRPQRHFDRTGVGRRHDADPMAGGDAQHLAGEVDRALELALAELRSMGAPEGGVCEGLEGPAGALGAGAGGEVRVRRPHAGHRNRHSLSFQIGAPRWGGVSRWRTYGRQAAQSSAELDDHLVPERLWRPTSILQSGSEPAVFTIQPLVGGACQKKGYPTSPHVIHATITRH